MKKIVLSILAAAAFLTTGCNEKVIENTGVGSVSFDLAYDGSDYVTKATEDAVSTDDFIITIERPADGWKKVYDRYADMPQTIDLGSGVYTLTATSPKTEPAAFDQPIYGGSKEFTVVAGQTTAVQLTCTLQNMKVTLKPTENFLAELSAFAVTVSNGDGTLVWRTEDLKSDDIKAGYFTVAPLHVHVDGRRSQDGSEASYDGDITAVAARDHHVITLDAQVTGSAKGISITVDLTTNDVKNEIVVPGFEEIPVDGPDQPVDPDPVDPDEPEDPDAPSLVWPANENLDVMEIVDGMDVTLTINAPKKIASFVIKLQSDTDAFMRLVSLMTSNPIEDTDAVPEYVSIDLINDPTSVAAMGAIGIPTGTNLLGQESVPFSLSTLVPMIPSAGQAGPDTYHSFTLEVGDEAGNVKSWELVFHVPAN